MTGCLMCGLPTTSSSGLCHLCRNLTANVVVTVPPPSVDVEEKKTLRYARANDTTVASMLHLGASMEDVVGVLAYEKAQLQKVILEMCNVSVGQRAVTYPQPEESKKE